MQRCQPMFLRFGEDADAVQEPSDDNDAYSPHPHASVANLQLAVGQPPTPFLLATHGYFVSNEQASDVCF